MQNLPPATSPLHHWLDGRSGNLCLKVIDESIPSRLHPILLDLYPNGDMFVTANGSVAPWTGLWTAPTKTELFVDFAVDVPCQEGTSIIPGSPLKTVYSIAEECTLIDNTCVYASTTRGYAFLLTPVLPTISGPSFEAAQIFSLIHK